jgi:hypothetical protein
MNNAAAAAVPKPALHAWIPRVAAWIAGIAILLHGAANLAVRQRFGRGVPENLLTEELGPTPPDEPSVRR